MIKRDAATIQQMREIKSYLIFVKSIYDTELFREVLYGFIPKLKVKKVKKSVKKPSKVKKVMKEFKEGSLHSGSKKGPVVSNPKQAIAIGLSEQRKGRK